MTTHRYRVDATVRVSYEVDGASPDESKAVAWLVIASGDAKLVEIASASAVEITHDEQLAVRNLQYWLDAQAIALRGNEAAREAIATGKTVSRTELDAFARNELFEAYNGFQRWRPIRYGEVRHADSCRDHTVIARTISQGCQRWYRPRDLRGAEMETLARIKSCSRQVNQHPWLVKTWESVSVDVRWHTMTCEACNAQVVKPSVMVTIPWGTRTLSKEYAL